MVLVLAQHAGSDERDTLLGDVETLAVFHRVVAGDQARRDAVAMRNKATEDIGLDMDKANVEFRDGMVNAVVTATEKLIHARLDDAQHRKLINQFLDEVGTRPAGR